MFVFPAVPATLPNRSGEVPAERRVLQLLGEPWRKSSELPGTELDICGFCLAY